MDRQGVANFCCATKVAPLRNAACFVAQQNLFACARGRCLNRFRVFPIRDLEGTVRCVDGRGSVPAARMCELRATRTLPLPGGGESRATGTLPLPGGGESRATGMAAIPVVTNRGQRGRCPPALDFDYLSPLKWFIGGLHSR